MHEFSTMNIPLLLGIDFGTGGCKVTAIAPDGAFAGAANLAEVYLPDSVAAIGAGAFADCPKLDEIHGLDEVATVAADAFSGSLFETFRLAWSGTVVTGFKGPCPAEIVIPERIGDHIVNVAESLCESYKDL